VSRADDFDDFLAAAHRGKPELDLTVNDRMKAGAGIAANVIRPLIVGPDSESEQWVAEVARAVGCPYTVLQKQRRGDHDVEISLPESGDWSGVTPVLVDDIVSTAGTMIAAARQIQSRDLAPPVCIAVHALFAGDAYAALTVAGVDRILSCNTITHASNRIDLSAPIAAAIEALLANRSAPSMREST
jgi:ribose-phosphate pyrophosphokinase